MISPAKILLSRHLSATPRTWLQNKTNKFTITHKINKLSTCIHGEITTTYNNFSVPPMVYPPTVQNSNNITISFNTAPTVPNMLLYPMFNQGFGQQQQFLHKNTQHNNNSLLRHQTNSNISNNNDFMKQLAREVCKQLSNKDK